MTLEVCICLSNIVITIMLKGSTTLCYSLLVTTGDVDVMEQGV